MDKLKMHSPDITQQNIDKLLELFPNCKTEKQDANGELSTGVDFDLLKQELSKNIVEGPQERYQLNWPGKKEALLTANAPIAKTLRPCREESVDFDATENLFVEGDNLDALKLLQETYLGKVKMIYIDPPYNTGKDFIYADNFAESTDEYLQESGQKDEEGNRLSVNTNSNGRFHSDWLSMMYSRLKLARNLLKDDGVIFISIDENEISNLETIVANIFGPENFIGSLPVVMNLKGNQDAFGFAETHEFVVVATKNKELCMLNHFPLDDEELDDWSEDEHGLYKKADTLRRTGQDAARVSRPKGWFPVFIDGEDNVYVTEDNKPKAPGHTVLYPINGAEEELSWSWGKQKISREPHNLIIISGRSGKNIYKKQRPSLGELPTKKPKSLFYKPEYSSSTATTQLKNLFEKKLFDGPKPVPFIKDICLIGTNDDDIILDFFAGSATTAHAVIQLNAEDGGDRKFIMVQLPESCDENSEAFKSGYQTIAEISKERIRRAGKKIKEAYPQATELDAGFRVLKIDSSNMNEVHYTPDSVSKGDLFNQVEHIKTDRSSEDLLFQVMLDWGVDLSLPIRKETIEGKEVYFVNDDDQAPCDLVACFDKGINEALIKALAAKQPLRVVFRDDGFGSGNDSDSVKIKVEQIIKLLAPATDIKAI